MSKLCKPGGTHASILISWLCALPPGDAPASQCTSAQATQVRNKQTDKRAENGESVRSRHVKVFQLLGIQGDGDGRGVVPFICRPRESLGLSVTLVPECF